MKFFSALKKKWEAWYYGEADEPEEEWEDEEPEHSERFFNDADSRTVYILESLGQMSEAADKSEQSRDEYEAVTALLMDMDAIEKLPNDIKSVIIDDAGKIEQIEKARRQIFLNGGKMKEKRIQQLERLEDDIPSGIGKMREAEKYRNLVLRDLKRLDAERNSYRFQMREAQITLANSKGIAVICATAMICCIILLMILQFVFELEVIWGYLLICAAGAVTLTALFVKHSDAIRDLKRLEKIRNRLIALHNTVKIRYVNNTKLLSYLYMKYGTESSDDLEEEWELYTSEVAARAKDNELKQELNYYYDRLTETLRTNGIKDPEIWIRQTEALLDQREMVEVRHALIARRGQLREQLVYNKEIAEKAQKKIKDLAKNFPQYSAEIADIVERYDDKGKR
ncbi:hypothetical protein SAMN02910370_01132 [Lachnospiraceae bacterium XPB1003]|nr:hypothetical protein SAMN02910370_01132 [Lachnospiraceae bacterium XPB1003]